MNASTRYKPFALALLLTVGLAAGGGCAETTEPATQTGEPDQSESGEEPIPGGKGDRVGSVEYDFGFDQKPKLAEYNHRVDFLGLSLTGTEPLQRSDSYNCKGPNTFNLTLLEIYTRLVELHRRWGDDFREAGYETCQIDAADEEKLSAVRSRVEEADSLAEKADLLGDFLSTVPCTLQKVYRKHPDGTVTGGLRTVDLLTPDVARVDLDEPAGFPNGRRPQDQVTDNVLAMAFSKLGDEDEGPYVNDFNLNPPENDVPFRDSFPYLAGPHYYDADDY